MFCTQKPRYKDNVAQKIPEKIQELYSFLKNLVLKSKINYLTHSAYITDF